MRLRLNLTTPALAQAGVPTKLWNSMPIKVARIIGLRIAIPGILRSRMARPATPAVRISPGTALNGPPAFGAVTGGFEGATLRPGIGNGILHGSGSSLDDFIVMKSKQTVQQLIFLQLI